VRKSFVCMIVLFAFRAYADEKSEGGDVGKDRDILSVIEENLKAAEKEDFDAWLKTYHEQARSCEARGAEMRECFRIYDMRYELGQVRVLDRSDEEARVWFLQINRRVSGPEMADKEVAGIHLMKKSYGKWKIYDTEIQKIREMR